MASLSRTSHCVHCTQGVQRMRCRWRLSDSEQMPNLLGMLLSREQPTWMLQLWYGISAWALPYTAATVLEA